MEVESGQQWLRPVLSPMPYPYYCSAHGVLATPPYLLTDPLHLNHTEFDHIPIVPVIFAMEYLLCACRG